MLPYLQDNDGQAARGSASTSGAAGKKPAGASAATDQISSEEDYLVPAEHGRNARHSTMTLVVLFALGALCVWFMVKKTTPAPADAAVSAEEQQITEAIAQLTGIRQDITRKVDDIVGRFNQVTDVEQVGVFELKKNPFRTDILLGGEVQLPSMEEQMMWKREEVQQRAAGLQLLSIIRSPKGSCCMINEKLLYIGDSIEGFTVTQIFDKYVEITSNGITVQLKMAE